MTFVTPLHQEHEMTRLLRQSVYYRSGVHKIDLGTRDRAYV